MSSLNNSGQPPMHDAQQTDENELLDQQLKQWYAESKASQPMPEALKQQFSAQLPPNQVIDLATWRRRATEWVALAACALLILFWQKPELVLYKIDQVQQQERLIVVHYLDAENNEPRSQLAENNAKRQQLYQQAYQDYLNSSQLTAAQYEQVFFRQDIAAGWQLTGCDPLVVQINRDLLERWQQQQPSEWQQLEKSQFVRLKFGEQGQIMAITESAVAPNCTAI